MSINRRPVYINGDAQQWNSNPSSDLQDVRNFHKQIPGYEPTRLVSFADLAAELGIKNLYIKDEGNRMGLPSFKILGASWGTYRAVARANGLTTEAGLEAVRQAAASNQHGLFAATDGNHGRAVARMASLLSLSARIYVPRGMDLATIDSIRREGAVVIDTGKSYDDAILEAEKGAKNECGLLIQDCAFEGYEEFPQWIVDGYSTCLYEIDAQLGEQQADFVFVPVGVGSLAQAVVTYYRKEGSPTTVIATEADTAACLWESLCKGESVSIQTTPTIMTGLDCGTVSTISWPSLKAGIGASVTVADIETHRAVLDFESHGVRAGPCGASGLAALRRLTSEDREGLGLGKESVVVLLSTEASRSYNLPRDVLLEDPRGLTEVLTDINSVDPTCGNGKGQGETKVAEYVMAWLEHRGIECHWLEPTAGRPSVIGVVRGTGGGKSLFLGGHLDVKPGSEVRGPRSASSKGGRVSGDGAADTKGGLAANMLALAGVQTLGLRGDVILTAVSDETGHNIGTRQVLEAGWWAHGAIITEPTCEQLMNQHKGTVWLDVDIRGNPTTQRRGKDDPIFQAAYFLVELDKHRERQVSGEKHRADPLHKVSVHASTGEAGVKLSEIPLCTVSLEWKTMPGETLESVKEEIQAVLEKVTEERPAFRSSLRVTFHRSPFSIPPTHEFVSLVSETVGRTLGRPSAFREDAGWTDCSLLAEVGIPAVVWGPVGAGASASAEEWVDTASVGRVAEGLTAIAQAFCR